MTPFVQSATNFASYLTVLVDVFCVAFFFVLITPLRRRGWTKQITEFIGENALLLGFLAALAALIGSLFYSEFANFQPCLLCWWQRILLFPQTIIFLVALIKKDQAARIYGIVLSALGAVVSTYHTFLQFGVLQSSLPCSLSGVSCEHVYFVSYGYITIPTMALTIFVLILLIMFASIATRRK